MFRPVNRGPEPSQGADRILDQDNHGLPAEPTSATDYSSLDDLAVLVLDADESVSKNVAVVRLRRWGEFQCDADLMHGAARWLPRPLSNLQRLLAANESRVVTLVSLVGRLLHVCESLGVVGFRGSVSRRC
ncbi:hypothetical protein SAMN04489812_1280 [Microlunatus soli]|uniref:Uncharacterized protein n=1 Tax=Microlunatus soli TaxID=630515 RepID=A0A1H1QIE7_9ACTN|nr:hypothetical protein SAMN04489812_1280 [Microlunatus soli]